MTKLKWVALATLSCFWACGSPEQSTIDQFFRAAQANDHVTVALMSAVSPPLEVDAWKVVEVTNRATEGFVLPEVHEDFAAAEKEKDAALAERKKFFEDNEEALGEIIPKLREDPEYQFRGNLGEIQEQWTTMLEERKEKERVFQDLKRKYDAESKLAAKSVVRKVSLDNFTGDVAVSELLLNLTTKAAGELPFKVTLRKYNVSDPGSDRAETARWVISGIEGASPEARAAAEAATRAREPAARTADATEPADEADGEEADADASKSGSARAEPARAARELRGEARVQVLTPETKVEGDEAVTKIQARNVSRGWISQFTVTEYWYDEGGNVVSSSSRTHRRRFMPGEVIELILRTRKDSKFYQNQFEFSHGNGEVKAAIVKNFPT